MPEARLTTEQRNYLLECLEHMPGDRPQGDIVFKLNDDPLSQRVPHGNVKESEAAMQTAIGEIRTGIPPSMKPGQIVHLSEQGQMFPTLSLKMEDNGTLQFWEPTGFMRLGGRPQLEISPGGDIKSFGKTVRPDLASKDYRALYNLVDQARHLMTNGKMRLQKERPSQPLRRG